MPVEVPLGLEETDDIVLLVVEADVEVPMEDVEVELAVDVLDWADVDGSEDVDVVEEDGMGTGGDVVVGRPGDADARDEDVLEPPD